MLFVDNIRIFDTFKPITVERLIVRYDNVTLIPLVLQLGLRISRGLINVIKHISPGTEINYFFPAKFLGAKFYFSVDEKEKSKHSDINE